ncbi:hypothetical protein POPA111323_07500 [Polynucleobacter paneuropaeus]
MGNLSSLCQSSVDLSDAGDKGTVYAGISYPYALSLWAILIQINMMPR